MILRHFDDQYFLLVDSYDPDLLVDIAVANLEVNSYGPLLLSVGERSEHTVGIIREELTFFTEADPGQDRVWRHRTLSIDQDSVVTRCHVYDFNAH